MQVKNKRIAIRAPIKPKISAKKVTTLPISPRYASIRERPKPRSQAVSVEKAVKVAIGFERAMKRESQRTKHRKAISKVIASSLKKAANKLDKKAKLGT